MVGALLGAWLILETNVTLLSNDGGPAHVMSCHKKKPIYDTPSTNQYQSGHVVTMSMHNVETFASINSRFECFFILTLQRAQSLGFVDH